MPSKSSRTLQRASAFGCIAALFFTGATAFGGELVLSEFNNTSFSYPFGSLSYTNGPNSVRLFGPNDSGGAGRSVGSLDLSGFADGRFVVDLFTNLGNQVDRFDLELIDNTNTAGKWSIGVSHLDDGVTTTLVSPTVLSNPTTTIVNDPVNGNPIVDLSNITTWQVVGTYSTPAPFDINFDRLAVSDMVAAPPAYPGAEPDAPWRALAASRIDANRKADIQINVTDSFGNPIAGASVTAQMTEHEFGFGSALRASRLSSQPANNTYRQKVQELFNTSVIENNLKWEPWAGEWGSGWTKTQAIVAVNWLNANGIDVRGHNLVWPGIENVANPAKALLQDFVDNGTPLTNGEQNQLRNLIENHIDDIANVFKGKLAAWDVINEPRSNGDVMDALSEGDLVMLDWFNQAQSIDPDAKRYINDFDILTSGGGVNTFNQQDAIDRLQFLIDNNAPIDGFGFQSHFREDTLTGPEQIWEIIDRFDALGLDLQITEFDFETTDEQLQADFTRDFMTAAFAHEGIDDFLHWGFWENEHWRPDAALFRSDWSIKPNGQVYMDLVFDEWWTDETLASGLDGLAELRGFKGDYEFTASFNGVEQTVVASLSDDGLTLNIVLDIGNLAADFNGDGSVDGADLAILWTNYGQLTGAAQASGDANGDGRIDGNDFLVWQQQFGTTPGGQLVATPEPNSIAMVCILTACFLGRRRRSNLC